MSQKKFKLRYASYNFSTKSYQKYKVRQNQSQWTNIESEIDIQSYH